MAIFVGGDTSTYTFDFGTKVAGSIAECPMKIYFSRTSKIQQPNANAPKTGADSGWYELGSNGDQSVIDVLKNRDNKSLILDTKEYNKNGLLQIMVEIDLNPICNSLFSGSNDALRNAIKKIEVETYAKGTGNHNGKATNGCKMYAWGTDNQWTDLSVVGGKNNTNEVRKMSYFVTSDGVIKLRVQDNNKIYILIASEYPASADIPSTLSLDYINIKLDLKREPDKLMFGDKEYMNVELGEEWSCFMSSFPKKDCSSDNPYSLYIGDSNMNYYVDTPARRNMFQFGFHHTAKKTSITCCKRDFQIKDYQNLKFLVVKKKDKLILYYLKNSGNVEKIVSDNPNQLELSGKQKLYIMTYPWDRSYNADAFLENFCFFDYAIAQNDDEAEVILKGRNEIDKSNKRLNELGKLFQNPNLMPDGFENWTKSPIARVENNELIQESSSILKEATNSNYRFDILPNNSYVINFEAMSDFAGVSCLNIFEYQNRYLFKITKNIYFDKSDYYKPYSFTFSTTSKTNNVLLRFLADLNFRGIAKIKNITLRRLD